MVVSCPSLPRAKAERASLNCLARNGLERCNERDKASTGGLGDHHAGEEEGDGEEGDGE
jgi:hypothetical protein